MQKIIEILVPLILIVVLLMCMMNNENEGFSVGSPCPRKIDGFSIGGQPSNVPTPTQPNDNVPSDDGNTCKVTMIWADWCGYSKKAKPEWDNLVNEMKTKKIDGYTLEFRDVEEKADPDTVKKYGTTGFPTYYVELSNKPGQKEEFNSIEQSDMLQKIESAISKLSSGESVAEESVEEEIQIRLCDKCGKRIEDCECEYDVPEARRPQPDESSIRPSVYGEILYSSCDNDYGPVRLESVDRNLSESLNQIQDVVGSADCTSLEYAPIKLALGGNQLPSSRASIPSLAQLKTPGIDSIQGIIRPLSFDTPVAKPSAGGDSDKTATVTMVWADWCGYSKKAKPEWDKLVAEINGQSISGCRMELRDLEQKKDEAEIKKNYSDVSGFPTYVVEVTDPSGKLLHKGDFNSIEKDDMLQKIKAEITKM